MRGFVAVVVVALATVAASTQQVEVEGQVEVELEQGRISGVREETETGRSFFSFKGIPYAQPPVGALRFKDPVAAPGWEGVRNGSSHPQACLQPTLESYFLYTKNFTGSEDCLYLNVYTPQQVSQMAVTLRLPVMVFIHGGGFVLGNVEEYDPSPLLQRDVVVVTLQYRLGVLGFLSTEDSVLPGNLGLKDQTLALRWVQKNIHNFGGDPGQVTLFGESAGAASVHFQVLSPHARGLFQRAILQSGTSLSHWALEDNHREIAFRLARHLNCTAQDSEQLVACVTNAPLEELALAPLSLEVWYYLPVVAAPRVDGDFLPDHPARLLKIGALNPVQLMTGITRHEGGMWAASFYTVHNESLASLKSNFSELLPMLMGYDEFLSYRVFFRYLSSANLTERDVDDLTEVFSDKSFRADHEDTAEFHVRAGQEVFLYEMDYRGQHGVCSVLNFSLTDNYTCHGDDLIYLFSLTSFNSTLTRPRDFLVRHIMVSLWTNFATTGNPTLNGSLGFRWTPYKASTDASATKGGSATISTTSSTDTADTLPYLLLSASPRMMHTSQSNTNFWRNLPEPKNKILYPERFYA